MPKRKRQVDRRPTPQLKRDRIERKGRRAFKNAQAKFRSRIGGMPLLELPFSDDSDELNDIFPQARR